MDDSTSDLEAFRKQWRAEVSARSKVDNSQQKSGASAGQTSKATYRRVPAPPKVLSEAVPKDDDLSEHEEETSNNATTVNSNDVAGYESKTGSREPRSALEHYEKAVEREAQGSLGDSLDLYRKAFRMDNRVDLKYKNKHFPPSQTAPKAAPMETSRLGNDLSTGNTASALLPLPINELLASFASLKIDAAPAEIEGDIPPACPLALLPEEILVHILTDLAVFDLASFARTAQVCKRLAYLVAKEEQIWKRVCLGNEIGFGAMFYTWQTDILGATIMEEDLDPPFHDGGEGPGVALALPNSPASMGDLLKNVYQSSWHRMFRMRPRVRFNGVYISTVNYIRPGQASANQVTWNSPVHIVTYYRYLRFFRDGTVLSLLTTSEPIDVVPYLGKEYQLTHRNNAAGHLPSAVMQTAHLGRWRLSNAADHPEAEAKDVEGDVFVETEGVGSKYIYRMELTLRSAGRGAKNNKLAWKGYWHYNKLTDDWGEFGLKNDKAFFWSRVKSYGMGA